MELSLEIVKNNSFKLALFTALVVAQAVIIAYLVTTPAEIDFDTVIVDGPEKEFSEPEDMGENPLDLDHYFGPPNGPDVWEVDREGVDYVEYSINSQGFRSTEDYQKEKPDDVFRIAIFGDSSVFGEFVNDSYVWTEKLEERLNEDLTTDHEYEVYNMGINAHDSPYTAEFYRREGSEYETDLDIFIMKDVEIFEAGEITTPIIEEHKENFEEEHGYRANPPSEEYYDVIDEAHEEYMEVIREMDDEELYEQQVYEPFEVIGNAADNRDDVLIFTLFFAENHYDVFKDAAEQEGFEHFSMNDIGEEYGYGGVWGQIAFPEIEDPHPDEAGNEFVSDVMYIYLMTNNLIDADYYDAFQPQGQN